MADWHGISLYSDLSWRSKHSCSGQHAILDSRSNLAAYSGALFCPYFECTTKFF